MTTEVEINGDPAADDDAAGKRAEDRVAVSRNENLSGLEHGPLTRHTLHSGIRKSSPLRSDRSGRRYAALTDASAPGGSQL